MTLGMPSKHNAISMGGLSNNTAIDLVYMGHEKQAGGNKEKTGVLGCSTAIKNITKTTRGHAAPARPSYMSNGEMKRSGKGLQPRAAVRRGVRQGRIIVRRSRSAAGPQLWWQLDPQAPQSCSCQRLASAGCQRVHYHESSRAAKASPRCRGGSREEGSRDQHRRTGCLRHGRMDTWPVNATFGAVARSYDRVSTVIA